MPNKVIAVTGATGCQGGGVVKVMKKTPGWTVRAITREPCSDAAQKLAKEGIEVARASFDDEPSLVKALEGVHAVFAVTVWMEYFAQGKTLDEAGMLEERDGMNIARAAAQTPTLEHYVWSTQPSSTRIKSEKLAVRHMDFKAKVDARIKKELPELAKKTSYLYVGYYPENMAYAPLLCPIKVPGSGYPGQPNTEKWVQIAPTCPDAKILNAGDLTANTGLYVRQAIATAPKSYGRYANVATEKMSFREMLDVWSDVTGHRGVFVQCSMDDWEKVWGLVAVEMGSQLRFGELCDPWEERGDFISAEELGLSYREVGGFRKGIERFRHVWT